MSTKADKEETTGSLIPNAEGIWERFKTLAQFNAVLRVQLKCSYRGHVTEYVGSMPFRQPDSDVRYEFHCRKCGLNYWQKLKYLSRVECQMIIDSDFSVQDTTRAQNRLEQLNMFDVGVKEK